jgi:hypothetical protein
MWLSAAALRVKRRRAGPLAQRTTLFARLTPMHKERIVTLLKREGHVVGFMGDGINDARRCARRTLVSPLTARLILPVKRLISSCWKRA